MKKGRGPKLAKIRTEKTLLKSFVFSLLFIGLGTVSCYSQASTASVITTAIPAKKLKTLVLDAGHGGKDYGAHRGWATEKNISLSIVMKVGRMIEAAYPDMKIIYTRKDDRFIELDERASIANRNKADLFISVHCNSATSSSPNGTETYALGVGRTQESIDIAKRENSVVLLEDNYEKRYDGFDPNSPEANIIFSLYQNKNLNKSLTIASKIEGEFEETDNRYSRGVKQANFLVLRKATMPAILVETGFVSNLGEGKYLAAEDGQDEVAASIFRAFKQYKTQQEAAH